MIEIITAILILIAAVFIFVRNIKKKSKNACDCGSCSAQCPSYKSEKK